MVTKRKYGASSSTVMLNSILQPLVRDWDLRFYNAIHIFILAELHWGAFQNFDGYAMGNTNDMGNRGVYHLQLVSCAVHLS